MELDSKMTLVAAAAAAAAPVVAAAAAAVVHVTAARTEFVYLASKMNLKIHQSVKNNKILYFSLHFQSHSEIIREREREIERGSNQIKVK
jgi:hypothetical protein